MNIKKKLLNIPLVKSLQTEYIGLEYRKEEKKRHNNYAKLKLPEGTPTPLVSIIILNRNGKDNFEILMPSMENCSFYDNFELIVVDNASTDDSISYIEKWKDKFNITIIRNDNNESFSKANNQGVAAASGDYLLFLNNDTRVTDGWLDELLKVALTEDKVGAVGAKLIYPKIPSNTVNEGKSFKIQHGGICFRDKIREKLYFIQPYNMGNGNKDIAPYTGYIERPCVTAALMLVSKDAFCKVGGFDEKYIYGYEDVDICLKLYKEGYHNYYCADSIVYHYEFGTQSIDDEDEVKNRRRHNMEVFKGKWQRFLFREIYSQKLQGKAFFSEEKLTFKILVPENEQYVALFEQIKGKLVEKGYSVKRQSYSIDKKYNIGVGTDVLISLDPDYYIKDISNIKNDLILFAWHNGNSELWSKQSFYADYTCVVEDNIGNIDAKVEFLIDYLKSLYTDSLDEHVIDICGAMPDNETTKFWGDYHYAVALKNEFEKNGYKANVLSRENWYNISNAKYTIVLRGLREYYPGYKDDRKYIMWNISHPADVNIDEYELYDYVFFASEHMQKMYKDKINVPSGVLPQCTDPEVMKSIDTGEKKYELLFVGNSRHVYRRILKDLIPTEYRLTVYGRHWDKFPVKEYVVQDYIDNNIVGQAYHDAKILLNDHWDDMREYGIISNRIFDALSAGAFVVSDYVPGIEDVLGDSVVTYDTPEDLKEKIDYYMKHEDERDAKALAGQKIVREKHTFANRVDGMLSVIVDL